MTRLIAVLSLAFLCGCTSDTFPKFTKLDSLRILALQSDKPEAKPGETVTITPIISDVNGAGRALLFSAEICVDPGTWRGAEPSCAGNPTRQVLQTDAAAAVPSGQATGPSTTITFPVTDAVLLNRSAIDRYNGLPYLFIYQLKGGSETVSSFLRVMVVESTKPSVNQNPAGPLDILFNGAASASVSTLPISKQSLTLQFPSTDLETYPYLALNGSVGQVQEELITTWFTSDGEIKFYRSLNDGSTEWEPPATAPSGRGVVVIAIVRDGRGGVSYTKKEF